MPQDCRLTPTPSQAARESDRAGRGLPDSILIAVTMLVGAIQRVVDAIYNHALITNAEAHAFLVASREVSVTAGTGNKIYENKLREPVVVYLRAQTANGIANYLRLSAKEIADTTHGKATVVHYTADGGATAILPPNSTLFADVGTTGNVVYSVLPLQGASGLVKE